jgi:hypothetical protein
MIIKTLAAYDSAQQLKPANERGGWIDRRLSMIEIRMNQKIAENPKEAVKKFVEIVLHRLPYMLLISLAFFRIDFEVGLLAKKTILLRRSWCFHHSSLCIYFSYIAFNICPAKSREQFHWNFAGTIATVIIFLLFFYMYAAMLRFYEQSKLKTFLKFILVNFSFSNDVDIIYHYYFLLSSYILIKYLWIKRTVKHFKGWCK